MELFFRNTFWWRQKRDGFQERNIPASRVTCALRAVVVAMSLVGLAAGTGAHAAVHLNSGCWLNGHELRGRVRVVRALADFKVRRVKALADLRVQHVRSLPSSCGQWQFVEAFADFTIKFVSVGEDFTIKMVSSFPGLP